MSREDKPHLSEGDIDATDLNGYHFVPRSTRILIVYS